MSIQDEINRLNQNVSNAYSALEDMGATLPTEQNSANIASAIRSIPQSGGGGGTLIVTATASFISETMGTVEGISHTFAEIKEAYNNNRCISLVLDMRPKYSRSILCELREVPTNYSCVFGFTGDIIGSFDGALHDVTIMLFSDPVESDILYTRQLGAQSQSGGSTLAIPCVLDLATMSATGIQIDAQTAIDAFNANKHIFLKVDASQMGDGTTSYTVASMTQFVIVPGNDVPLLGFDFIMMISGVPHLINAEWWAGSYSAPVTITPLATQS